MLSLELDQIARELGARLVGANATVDSVSTDTRTLAAGALFVALVGEQHDAHDFAESARARGAAALMVERELAVELPQLIVTDSLLALGELARFVRQRLDVRVIGITGSNGKTTVKSMLAAILARHGRTHFSVGSFNNEIGLPLTLLDMPEDCEYAVLEMGAGKPGDIAYLARIAGQQLALVNNIGSAHLLRMGSLDAIAETKSAIYATLPADGIAVINADDAYAACFAELAGTRRIVRFGLHGDVDVGVRAGSIAGQHFTLSTADADIDIELPLPGRHNITNALAAAALAIALGVPMATIKAGLDEVPQVAGRSHRIEHASGAVIIDDAYNANPVSFAAAVAMLAEQTGKRILVVGDMLELGADSERLHADIGALAKRSGIDALHAVGAMSRAAAHAFGEGGMHHADQATLIETLRTELRAGVSMLVKGSHGSAMERVVRALFEHEAANGERHAA